MTSNLAYIVSKWTSACQISSDCD